MPLSSVYEKLMALKKERSSNEKIKILKTYLKDPVFDVVVRMSLSHDKIYNIKSFGKYDAEAGGGSFEEIIRFLQNLEIQDGVTKIQKEELRQLASVNPETFYVVERIVNKDLRCGAQASLINKAVPDTVFVVPYMRCFTEKAGIKNIMYDGGAFCQKKADGGFCYGYNDHESGEPLLMTRNGKYMQMHGFFDKDIKKLRKTDEIITMEMTAVDEHGKDLPREISNGLVTKAIRGTITKEEAAKFRGQAWDIIPQKDFWNEYYPTPYELRWRRVTSVARNMDLINRIYSRRVYSEEEARVFFSEMRKKGFEGAILKNRTSPWKSHTSPNQVKLKRKHCAEFIVTGWYYGDTGKKYEKCLGGLNFESEDGLIKCNTGSGFTDEDRGFLGFDEDSIPLIDDQIVSDLDKWTGQIISVEFDSLIKDKSRKDGTWSLFLPIFDKARPDKVKADDYKYLRSL